MPIDMQPPRIRSEESPREILANDFKSVGEMPIRGGWGYTLDDAVIIDKNDPVVLKGVPFDGVGLERIFLEKRTYEELIIFRPQDDRYSGINWKLVQQTVTDHNHRTYDVLKVEITAFPDKDWEELKAEWEGPNGYGSPGFDLEAHNEKRDSRMIRYITEGYFDITSFYGADEN